MGKRISLRTICISATVSILIFHVFITVISSDAQRVDEGSNRDDEVTIESEGSREEKFDDFLGRDDMNEVSLEDGRKFRLFEKKRLPHKKAQTFCKKREGRLVRAENMDEMRRLQLLLMRARMIGDSIWVGADKKSWKNHQHKMLTKDRPNFNLGPEITQFGGGGPTEMCPALSTSTRSMVPAPCYNQLPFICEFDPGKGKLKKSSSGNKTKTAKKKVKKVKEKLRDEMRRKREVMNSTFTFYDGGENVSEAFLGENSTSTTTSVLDIDTKDDLNPTSPLSSSSSQHPDEDFIAAHKIGFFPHMIDLMHGTQNRTDYPEIETMTLDNFHGMIERVTPKKRKANSDIHLKFSTKLSLQTDNSMDDPDQQMLDLINEQSVNMMEDANITEEITFRNASDERSEKLISAASEDSGVIMMSTTSVPEGQSTEIGKMSQQKSRFVRATEESAEPEVTNPADIITSEEMAMTLSGSGRGGRSFGPSSKLNRVQELTTPQMESSKRGTQAYKDSAVTKSPNPEPEAEPSSSSITKSPNAEPEAEPSISAVPKSPSSEPEPESEASAGPVKKIPNPEPEAEPSVSTYTKSPSPEPEPESEVSAGAITKNPSPEPDVEPSASAFTKNPTPEPEPEAEVSVKPVSKSPNAEPEAEAEVSVKPDSKSPNAEPEAEAEVSVKPDSKSPNAEPEAEVSVKPDSKSPNAEPEAEVSVKPDSKSPNAEPEAEPSSTTITKSPSPEPEGEPSAATTSQPLAEPEAEAEAEPTIRSTTGLPSTTIRPKSTTQPTNSDKITTGVPILADYQTILTTPRHMLTTTTMPPPPMMTTTTVPPVKVTNHSLTGTAPKTTIDPMTKPMSTMSPPSNSGSLPNTTPGSNRGGKNFSMPGEHSPVANATSNNLDNDSHNKESNNVTLSSLLQPRVTTTGPTVKPGGLTISSTHSPLALLTLRVKSTIGSRVAKQNRVITTDVNGEMTKMKSSLPTHLLQPQN